MPPTPVRTRRTLVAVAAILALAAGVIVRLTTLDHGPRTSPAPLASWPWPHPSITTPYPGVTCWTDRSSPDGTIVRLVEFDFSRNPGLRFALYDQDQDDAKPFDDSVDYWAMGAAQATAHLNATHHGVVIAACNGLFFSTDNGPATASPNLTLPPYGYAHHVGPTVENGVVRYNVGNPRWTFGVKYDRQGAPAFDAVHQPDRKTLAQSFTFASAGAQCLIRDGRPLVIRPFPGPNGPSETQPVSTTPTEAGHIPVVDHIKTSRVSFGWSRDSRRLYLLFVRQSGTEAGSIQAFQMRGIGSSADSRTRMLAQGGWDITDEQRFWQRLAVWGAVNSDGGEVAQLALISPDGKYDVYPAQWASTVDDLPEQVLNSSAAASTPAGGSLMYWYVCDSPRQQMPRPAESDRSGR